MDWITEKFFHIGRFRPFNANSTQHKMMFVNPTYVLLTRQDLLDGTSYGLVPVGTVKCMSDYHVVVQRHSSKRIYRCPQHGIMAEEITDNKIVAYKCFAPRCGYSLADCYPPHKLHRLLTSDEGEHSKPIVVKKKE